MSDDELPEPAGVPHPIVAHVATLERLVLRYLDSHWRINADPLGLPSCPCRVCVDARAVMYPERETE